MIHLQGFLPLSAQTELGTSHLHRLGRFSAFFLSGVGGELPCCRCIPPPPRASCLNAFPRAALATQRLAYRGRRPPEGKLRGFPNKHPQGRTWHPRRLSRVIPPFVCNTGLGTHCYSHNFGHSCILLPLLRWLPCWRHRPRCDVKDTTGIAVGCEEFRILFI
jgi:hypothetical protein